MLAPSNWLMVEIACLKPVQLCMTTNPSSKVVATTDHRSTHSPGAW